MTITIDNKQDLMELALFMKKQDFCKSTTEAIRLLKQGAFSVYKNGEWIKVKVEYKLN